MKLKSVLDHTPARQDIVLEEAFNVMATGSPDSKQIRNYQDYTVGSFVAVDGVLKVTIYTK